MTNFFKWLRTKFYPGSKPAKTASRRPIVHHRPRTTQAPNKAPKKAQPKTTADDTIEYSATTGGRIEDNGPGKNVLIRNKYIREDSGTHETLKIVDESLLDEVEGGGVNTYDTGVFDRSKNWDSRSRK